MPRAKKEPADAAVVSAAVDAEPVTPPEPAQLEDTPGSEEVQVVLAAADEPVRCGGYVLTDAGWVIEDQPAPVEDAAAEPEQEN